MNEPEENSTGVWGEDIAFTKWDLAKIFGMVIGAALALGFSVGWLAIKLVEAIGG